MALLVLTWLNQNNLVRKSFAIKLQRKKKKKIWHKTTTTPNLLSGAKRPKANNTTTKNDLYKKVITLTKTVHQLLMCQYNLARAIADMLSSSATGLLMSFCFDLYLSSESSWGMLLVLFWYHKPSCSKALKGLSGIIFLLFPLYSGLVYLAVRPNAQSLRDAFFPHPSLSLIPSVWPS